MVFMAPLAYCRCPSHSRLTPAHLTHQKYSCLPSLPPRPMQASKPHQGTRSGELVFLQQGHHLLHLPAKPSYSCKQHAKIACCPLCMPVASFGPLLLLLLWFCHARKESTVNELLCHFAIVQKAICRAHRGAEGLRKFKLADTLRTVLLVMSCNCKVFFYIYIYFFFDTTFCKISNVM